MTTEIEALVEASRQEMRESPDEHLRALVAAAEAVIQPGATWREASDLRTSICEHEDHLRRGTRVLLEWELGLLNARRRTTPLYVFMDALRGNARLAHLPAHEESMRRQAADLVAAAVAIGT